MSRTTLWGPNGHPTPRPSMLNLRGRKRTAASLIRQAQRGTADRIRREAALQGAR